MVILTIKLEKAMGEERETENPVKRDQLGGSLLNASVI